MSAHTFTPRQRELNALTLFVVRDIIEEEGTIGQHWKPGELEEIANRIHQATNLVTYIGWEHK